MKSCSKSATDHEHFPDEESIKAWRDDELTCTSATSQGTFQSSWSSLESENSYTPGKSCLRKTIVKIRGSKTAKNVSFDTNLAVYSDENDLTSEQVDSRWYGRWELEQMKEEHRIHIVSIVWEKYNNTSYHATLKRLNKACVEDSVGDLEISQLHSAIERNADLVGMERCVEEVSRAFAVRRKEMNDEVAKTTKKLVSNAK